MEVIENNNAFRFIFDDNEEATEWRDKLRDGGFSANMPDSKNKWIVEVEKENIRYAFFREWVLLRSPDKYFNQSHFLTVNQCIGKLKEVCAKLEDHDCAWSLDFIVKDVEEFLDE